MKLRLTQAGFATYSGQMGVLWFEDGVSTTDVRPQDARRMAATMLCEWEDGSSPSMSQAILDNANTPAPIFAADHHDKEAAVTAAAELKAIAAEAVRDEAYADATRADRPMSAGITRDQLAAIADKDGITGLRKIADPLGIKGNSINGLIEALLTSRAATPQAM